MKEQLDFKQYLADYFKKNWQPLTMGFISGLVADRLLPIFLAMLVFAAGIYYVSGKRRKVTNGNAE